MKVLFVCIENSNRSQMSQAFATMTGGDKIRAFSAGSNPSGKINPKAVAAMKELGYEVEAYLWVGLFTAAGVPEATMTKLREVVRKAVADPLFQDAMAKASVVIDYRDTPEFRKFFDADYKRLAGAVKAIGRLDEHK